MDRTASRLTASGNGYLLLPLLILLLLTSPGWKQLSLSLYRLWEPNLVLPVEQQPAAALRIRNDAYGSGEFGARRRGKRHHAGIDLLAPLGSPVKAARSGWVSTGYKQNGYGHFVEIKHLDGSETLYAHLARVDVRDKQWVWQGQHVGIIGKTGNASHHKGILPHLHFEVRMDGKAIDPKLLLMIGDPPTQRTKLAAIGTGFPLERTGGAGR